MLSRHRHIYFGILPTLLLIVCLPAGTGAHPLTATETTVRLGTDGTFQADLIVDLDALALGAPQDTDDAELVTALNGLSQDEFDTRLAQLRRLFQRRVRLRFDGTPGPRHTGQHRCNHPNRAWVNGQTDRHHTRGHHST